MKIGKYELTTIDWDSLKVSNMALSRGKRETRSKFVYRWAATGAQNTLLYGDNNSCVHCKQVEDHEHVLMCKALVVVDTRETL